MDWSSVAQFEWIILELLALGLIVWQVVSVRRSIRRDRQIANAKIDKAQAE